MPIKDNIRTIHDVHTAAGSGERNQQHNPSNSNGVVSTPANLCDTKCHPIPSLPTAHEAKAILERVLREFNPIIRQRSYNVRTVAELCCCDDGLRYENNPAGKVKRRRKTSKKSSGNLWGYNRTTRYGKSQFHEIHLRVRRFEDHTRFLDYEDIAGTMAHELAHCEHGPHNAKFYKLMDEILDQHAVLMAARLTHHGETLPAFGGDGYSLGGGGNGSLQAARRQQQQQQSSSSTTSQSGYKLGGENAFQQWMTPAEAAVVAAEARRRQQQLRLRGDHCCQPCIIELDESSDEGSDDSSSITQKGRKKATVPYCSALTNVDNQTIPKHTSERKSPHLADCIDLTNEPSDDEKVENERTVNRSSSTNSSSYSRWSCRHCTYLNPKGFDRCGMCDADGS